MSSHIIGVTREGCGFGEKVQVTHRKTSAGPKLHELQRIYFIGDWWEPC